MNDQEQKLARLEARLAGLERDLAEERASGAQRRQRERWARIAFWVLIGVAYVVYANKISGLG